MARSSRQQTRAHKRPRIAERPTPRKQPRSDDPVIGGLPLAWRFSDHDRGGPWAWSGLDDASEYKRVMEQLHEFERMNWNAIVGRGSHEIERGRLAKRARDRLEKIGQDDVDHLMSFRVTGKNRVWCIRDRNIMRVLWWDPNHSVCPALKKHT